MPLAYDATPDLTYGLTFPLAWAAAVVAPVVTGVPAPTITGSPTLVGSYDFDNASSLNLTGSVINSVDGSDSLTGITMTSSGSPTLVTRSGRNAAFFVAASTQRLVYGGDFGLSVAGEATFVVVFESTVHTPQMQLFEVSKTGVSSSTSKLAARIHGSSNQFHSYKGDNSGTPALAFSATGYATGLHLLVTRYPTLTTAHTLNVDGVGAAVTSGSSIAWPSGMNSAVIGAQNSSGTFNQYLDGYIMRVLVYNSALSNAQAEEIAVWAATNYGTTNAA